MTPGITFTATWSDDDILELSITVCNDESSFTNSVYAGIEDLQKLATELNAFRDKIYGGLYDIAIGAFGPEYANGGFHARLHFIKPGLLKGGRRLHISTHQECSYQEFSRGPVAAEAKMYLAAEPGQLDVFVEELKRLSNGKANEATLKCLSKSDA